MRYIPRSMGNETSNISRAETEEKQEEEKEVNSDQPVLVLVVASCVQPHSTPFTDPE